MEENKYLKKVRYNTTVLNSDCDKEFCMRVDKMFSLFQDTGMIHLKNLGLDMESLAKNSNGMWIVTKYKVKLIGSKPKLMDKICCETWPLEAKFAKFDRLFIILSGSNEKVLCSSEWCVLDKDTMRIKPAKNIQMPQIEYLKKDIDIGGYEKFEETFENDYLFSYIIHRSDIDQNDHTNNVTYVRLSIDAIPYEEYKEYTTFEIHFISQSHLNDNIRIYSKKVENGRIITGYKEYTKIFESKMSK